MDINLYGEVPSEPIVMAACDSKYFLEHGLAFVKSASDNGNNVHIHIINPTNEALAFCSILNGLTDKLVTYTFNDFEFPKQWSDTNIKALYASLRFLVAPLLLPHARQIMILDIDSIIMNPIPLAEYHFRMKDMGYFPREPLPGTVGWEQEGTKVAAGAIFYNHTDRGDKIAMEVAQQIRGLPLEWFVDQIALNRVITSNMEKDEYINFIKFDSKFMDWEFEKGTTIWTGKGPRKYDNPTYVSEKESYNKYLDEFKKYDTIILKPRMDAMFKRGLIKRSKKIAYPVRKYWLKYCDMKAKENPNSITLEAPRWEFKPEILNWANENAKMYCPHFDKVRWGGDDRCIYYMQSVFPWKFTEDTKGILAEGAYVDTFDPNAEYTDDAFNELSKYAKEGGTKFQGAQGELSEPLQKGKSLGIPFVLVLLQTPGDVTLKYHSDVEINEFIKKIIDWTDNNEDAPHIIFKVHPLKPNELHDMYLKHDKRRLGKARARGMHDDYFPLKDAFPEAEAVFVINSGTGTEAMLWDLPVVAFGRADYSPAVIKGNIDDLNFTWEAVKHDDHESRKRQYRRWFDWYVNKATVDVGKEDFIT